MNLRIRDWPTSNGFTVVELEGELDCYTAELLERSLAELVAEGHYQLILDMDGLDHIDSAGLGIIVSGLHKVRAHGGSLTVVCTQSRTKKFFTMSGLSRVFAVSDTVAGAASGTRMQKELARLIDKEVEVGGNWLQVRIYLTNSNESQTVERAVNKFVDEVGIDVVYSFPPIRGSWFREKLAHAKKDGTLVEQLALAERALQMQVLIKEQSDVDKSQADAAATLIASLEKSSSALVQVGSILILKHSGTLIVRNLTQRELAYFERNPSLFRHPAAALKELQRADAEADEGLRLGDVTPIPHANGIAASLCTCGSGLTLIECQCGATSAEPQGAFG